MNHNDRPAYWESAAKILAAALLGLIVGYGLEWWLISA